MPFANAHSNTLTYAHRHRINIHSKTDRIQTDHKQHSVRYNFVVLAIFFPSLFPTQFTICNFDIFPPCCRLKISWLSQESFFFKWMYTLNLFDFESLLSNEKKKNNYTLLKEKKKIHNLCGSISVSLTLVLFCPLHVG